VLELVPCRGLAKVVVDAALCTWWQSALAQHDGPIYLWADSSPQAGADWLLSIAMLIRGDDLLSLADAASELTRSVQDRGSDLFPETSLVCCENVLHL
jgi:hypothetical protein